jgi:hypothetical protein
MHETRNINKSQFFHSFDEEVQRTDLQHKQKQTK